MRRTESNDPTAGADRLAGEPSSGEDDPARGPAPDPAGVPAPDPDRRGGTAAGRHSADAVADHVSKGLEEDHGFVARLFAGSGEILLVAVEIFVAVGILRIKHFRPLVVALVAAWGIFRIAGYYRRLRASRRTRVLLERGVSALRARDYGTAGSSFSEAFRLSHREEAGLGYAYAAGKAGDMPELLRAARLLFRASLVRFSPQEILDTEGYRSFLADPDFRAIRPRLRAILVGDEDELAHIAPGVIRRRLVQVIVGLVLFVLLAFIVTAVMTFL